MCYLLFAFADIKKMFYHFCCHLCYEKGNAWRMDLDHKAQSFVGGCRAEKSKSDFNSLVVYLIFNHILS